MLAGLPCRAATVYVVMGCDTSIWHNLEGGNVADSFANEFDFDVFNNREAVLRDVFDEDFRQAHTDSRGQPFTMSWFMHGGGWFLRGTNTTSASTTFLINRHWKEEMARWGDEIAYHFHHFQWTGSRWAQADTFAETIWDFEWTMSQMIIDEEVFPVSFRAGWNYMDTPYQNYLERWMPFRYEGRRSTPYHPSFTNWATPGDMKGWEARHFYMKTFAANQSQADAVFAAADGGTDQVICPWSHQNEPDFIAQIDGVHATLESAAASYPEVEFLYCTGREAMQLYMAANPHTIPGVVLPPTPKLIVDNDLGAPHYTETGSWSVSSNIGYDRGGYHFAQAGTAATATWRAFLAEAGEYEVKTAFLQSPNRPNDVRFIVKAADGDHVVSIDQMTDGTQAVVERSLGIFEFAQDGGEVTVDAEASSPTTNFAIADAILFEPQFSMRSVGAGPPRGGEEYPDTTPPALDIATALASGGLSVTITTEDDIFQEQPWVAVRNFGDVYSRLDTTPVAPGVWKFFYNPQEIDRAVVAVCDVWGNVAMKEVIDGSARWSTQSEFERAAPQNIDTETLPYEARLAEISQATPAPVISQTMNDASTGAIERAYWIGQSFVPESAEISRIDFGATITEPSEFQIELRPLLPSGLPDDNPDALIAGGNAPLAASGDASVAFDPPVPVIQDGRSYAIVTKLVSGAGKMRLNTDDPYSSGTLLRAWSMDWITIPAFDGVFRIYDGTGNLVAEQAVSNGTAYAAESGRFISQTFQNESELIAGIEVYITNLNGNSDALLVQLRPTMEDGKPDYRQDAVIDSITTQISQTGVLNVPVEWSIPAEFVGKKLAMSFLSPEWGASLIELGHSNTDSYLDGALFITEGLIHDGAASNADLYFRILEPNFEPSAGTLTFEHDAGSVVVWQRANLYALVLEGVDASVRFRFADTLEELSTQPWSSYYTGPDITFDAPLSGRCMEAEVLLESESGVAPTLQALEITYTGIDASAVSSIVVFN